MQASNPIFTIDLFPLLDQKLITLLHSLSAADWEKPTIASRWCVKDIAAHLLDGNLRTLSMLRDGYWGESGGNLTSYSALVEFLNGLNADWVRAMRRVSPVVLIALLENSGQEYYQYLASLDPFAPATFSVAWAGEETSANWFHIAREYTEKWHHQQQIRLAVGQEAELYQQELYFPYLDTSLRALPFHYRGVEAPHDTIIQVHVTGEGGGDWFLHRTSNEWQLIMKPDKFPACVVSIPGEIAWRIFTKGISRQEANSLVQISGDPALGLPIFDLLAVMA
ncbi:MAG: maleylpyruvate isomerase N-terminal domain-containing protein [Lewinellaceae bacterium]|nr:maleylpyruvate isomerase N-terminal domain-containing protein [Lewinellaceae bacterium]